MSMGFDQVYSARQEFSPLMQTSNSIRKWLVVPMIQTCHSCTSGLILPVQLIVQHARTGLSKTALQFFLSSLHSTSWHCESKPIGRKLPARSNLIFPCLVADTYGIFRNRVLPSSSVGQQTTVAIIFLSGLLGGILDQQLTGGNLPL